MFGEEHGGTADSYELLAETQNMIGDFTSALQSHQRALAIRIKLFGEEHESTAASYIKLAKTQSMMGDVTSASQPEGRAFVICLKLFAEDTTGCNTTHDG